MSAPIPFQSEAPQPVDFDLDSLFDIAVAGGPLMIPIAACSVVALAYMVERSVRLRTTRLGTARFGSQLVTSVREGGAKRGLEECLKSRTPLARILAAGLQRADRPHAEREKAAEDAGLREVRRLSVGMRPLVVVTTIAPLLGLLGTVWGMILAFSNIALQDAIGKPEHLASGISQALITTAAGLVVAIPTQAVYYYFRSRIDRFARLAEDVQAELELALEGRKERAA
jgi:biopolymer transport protein ExbB